MRRRDRHVPRPAPPELQARVREQIADIGEVNFANDVGVSRLTVTRALAGLDLRENSLRRLEGHFEGSKKSEDSRG